MAKTEDIAYKVAVNAVQGVLNGAVDIAADAPVAVGFAVPPVLPIVRPNNVAETTGDNPTQVANVAASYCSVSLRCPEISETWFVFPLDPLISISGTNNIVKRDVMKHDERMPHHGSVKELWSRGDYSVNISGVLIGQNNEYPSADILKLRNLCEARKALEIQCEILNPFNIKHIVVENFDFPFTKGMENQQFTLRCISDDDFDLLVKTAVE